MTIEPRWTQHRVAARFAAAVALAFERTAEQV